MKFKQRNKRNNGSIICSLHVLNDNVIHLQSSKVSSHVKNKGNLVCPTHLPKQRPRWRSVCVYAASIKTGCGAYIK